jgi:hypothetical protein
MLQLVMPNSDDVINSEVAHYPYQHVLNLGCILEPGGVAREE